jgi:hypothetical protein
MMQPGTPQISKSVVLVVEGHDDEYFFNALLRHRGIAGVQVVPIEGKPSYKEKIRMVTISPGFARRVASLGLVRDADGDPAATIASMQGAVAAAGLQAPPRALVAAHGNPRVTLMVLPGAGQKGALEDLCLCAVNTQPAMGCVDEYFECLRKRGVPLPNQMSKAKVLAFLASRELPDGRIGIAAERGYWPWDSGAFSDLQRFLDLLLD